MLGHTNSPVVFEPSEFSCVYWVLRCGSIVFQNGAEWCECEMRGSFFLRIHHHRLHGRGKKNWVSATRKIDPVRLSGFEPQKLRGGQKWESFCSARILQSERVSLSQFIAILNCSRLISLLIPDLVCQTVHLIKCKYCFEIFSRKAFFAPLDRKIFLSKNKLPHIAQGLKMQFIQ